MEKNISCHLALLLGPTALGHPDTIAYAVGGELTPSWVTAARILPRLTADPTMTLA
jgi:hypothetical protein